MLPVNIVDTPLHRSPAAGCVYLTITVMQVMARATDDCLGITRKKNANWERDQDQPPDYYLNRNADKSINQSINTL